MILSEIDLNAHLNGGVSELDRFDIAPKPTQGSVKGASIDLRLGTWFLVPRTVRHSYYSLLDSHEGSLHEDDASSKHYVRFGGEFHLHPGSFVLAATMEWIKMPRSLCGYVTGKSSLGRRGLVIETAPGVHPGFAGCLTLELANVGVVPLILTPGIPVCQLFLHRLQSPVDLETESKFSALRQPKLGSPSRDAFARKLQSASA
jgi:dCTP deaminase